MVRCSGTVKIGHSDATEAASGATAGMTPTKRRGLDPDWAFVRASAWTWTWLCG